MTEAPRARAAVARPGFGRSAARTPLTDPVDVDEHVACPHMRIVDRLGRGQNRRDARVAIRENPRPVVPSFLPEFVRQGIAHRGPAGTLPLRAQGVRVDLQQPQQLGEEGRFKRTHGDVATVRAFVGAVERR